VGAHQTQSDPAGLKQAREAPATLLHCAGRRAAIPRPFQLVASTIKKPSRSRTRPAQAHLGPPEPIWSQGAQAMEQSPPELPVAWPHHWITSPPARVTRPRRTRAASSMTRGKKNHHRRRRPGFARPPVPTAAMEGRGRRGGRPSAGWRRPRRPRGGGGERGEGVFFRVSRIVRFPRWRMFTVSFLAPLFLALL
jgi:hypothetical protein